MSEELRFDGEVAIVAGGGGSLGGAHARMFGARGAKVLVNDIDEGARRVADEIVAAGGEAYPVIASAAESAQAIVDAAVERFGRLDVVVNSAGLTGGAPLAQTTPEVWDKVLTSHLGATFALARAAWPHLVASGNGRLINTASTALFSSPDSSAYVAAKAAIHAASRAWAMEGARENVRVNVILPTAISQMTRQIPDADMVALLEREFPPERVSGLVGYLAHRDTTITCCALEVGGGRASPVFVAEGDSFRVDAPENPESWVGHDAQMLSRQTKYTPVSMLEELEIRLRDMGPQFAGNSDVWSGQRH